MINRGLIVGVALAALALTGTAQAAIIEQTTDRVSFANAGSTSAQALSLNVPASDLQVGPVTIAAQDGNLFGDGATVSTELDEDVLLLTFAQPIVRLGLTGGVTDEAFGFIAGTLRIELPDTSFVELVNLAGVPGFVGFTSDVAFGSLRISVINFDVDASSVAFATLQDQLDVGAAVVPEPAALSFFGVGLVGLVGLRRRRA